MGGDFFSTGRSDAAFSFVNLHPIPPPFPLGRERGSTSEEDEKGEQTMIAKNLTKYEDAMIRQLELDLVVEGAGEQQRSAWWSWLLNTGRVIVRKVVAPTWWTAMKRRAQALEKAVKAALMTIF